MIKFSEKLYKRQIGMIKMIEQERKERICLRLSDGRHLRPGSIRRLKIREISAHGRMFNFYRLRLCMMCGMREYKIEATYDLRVRNPMYYRDMDDLNTFMKKHMKRLGDSGWK